MFKIIGTGKYLPKRVMTNFDLEKIVDTNDKWIRERTGICERRIASDNELNSDMAVEAAKDCIKKASLTEKDIDILIVSTCTPDYSIPAVAPIVQYKLGCGYIPAFDINSVCTSFAYALITAVGIINSGFYENCLVIGSDIYSRILNWKDRNTCCIFGDGAGAALLKRDNKARGILSHVYGADGKDSELIKIPIGGTKFPYHFSNEYKKEDLYFQMAGTSVYEFTITMVPQIVKDLMEKADLSKDEIDLIVLHQANRRIIESVSKQLKIPLEKFFININKYGNTSSASIPIALDEALSEGQLKEGDQVMLVGFGGGLSWGGVIIEW